MQLRKDGCLQLLTGLAHLNSYTGTEIILTLIYADHAHSNINREIV